MTIGIRSISISGVRAVGAPGVSLSISATSIAENAAPGDSIGTLSASGGVGPYTYAIDTDTDAKFAIGGAGSDELVIRTGASLDYETKTSHSVTIQVTDTGDGNATYLKTLTITVINRLAPANTAAPTVSGTLKVGTTLSVTNGSWDSSPSSYARQWQRSADGSSWSDISGATGTTYTTVSSDDLQYIRARVTATNVEGSSAPAASPATGQITYNTPTNSAVPTTSGTESVGSVLTSTTGTWTNSPTSYTYQWQQSDDGSTGWANISGATANNYTLGVGDEGKYLRCVVTATNSGGSASANSAASGQISAAAPDAPVLTGPLSVDEGAGTAGYSSDIGAVHYWAYFPNGTGIGTGDGDLIEAGTGALDHGSFTALSGTINEAITFASGINETDGEFAVVARVEGPPNSAWSNVLVDTTVSVNTMPSGPALVDSVISLASNVSAFSVTLPTYSIGDMLSISVIISQGKEINTPAGWTLAGSKAGFSTGNAAIRHYKRLADGSEGSSVAFTYSAAGPGNSTSMASAWSGASDIIAGAGNAGYGSTLSTGTVSAADGSLIFSIFSIRNTTFTSIPGTLMEQDETQFFRFGAGYIGPVSAGTTTAQTATAAAGASWAAMQIEVLA